MGRAVAGWLAGRHRTAGAAAVPAHTAHTARHCRPPAALQVAAVVLRELRRLNSEYRSYVPEDKQAPIVRLYAFGDPEWFPVNTKHKWTS